MYILTDSLNYTCAALTWEKCMEEMERLGLHPPIRIWHYVEDEAPKLIAHFSFDGAVAT